MAWQRGERVVIPAFERPLECSGCALFTRSTGFAKPEGTGANGVIAVAERLGDNEVESGYGLSPAGAAGSIFERTLKRIGATRSQFKILNILQCKIPDIDLKHRDYEFGAIEHCRVHRDPVMLNMPDVGVSYKRKVILAMGDIATRTLTGFSGKWHGIDQMRGYPLETAYGLVLPTYNPAKIYRESKLLGVFKHDLEYAINIAKHGWNPPVKHYQESPLVEEGWEFYYKAKALCEASPNNVVITADIENDFDPQIVLTSVQFSLAKDTGIFFDATNEFMPIIKALFALKAQWWFHNGWRHDKPILEAAGIVFGGDVLDSLWAFHHFQPDLTTQDSKDDEGIGISSKMGLQYVASLYGYHARWKHEVKSRPRWYGINDVDALQYIVPPLVQQLQRMGMWESYLKHVHRYDPIIVRVSERGIPVHEPTRQVVRAQMVQDLAKVADEIQLAYPAHLKNIYPKQGYVRPPKPKEGVIRLDPISQVDAVVAQARSFAEDIEDHGLSLGRSPALVLGQVYEWFDEDDKIWRPMELRLFTGLKLKKKIACQCFILQPANAKGKAFKKPKKVYSPDCTLCAGKKSYVTIATEEHRWCQVLPFKPSQAQLIKYMNFRKHKVPSKKKTDGTRGATSDFKELQKLAVKHSDPLYTKVVEYRKFEKVIGTYIDGWAPGSDGRVHGELLQSTATAQLASHSPNLLNPIKHNEELANKFRSMIQAPAGFTWVEMDYKSYHGATLAAESGDEVYYKVAVQAGDAHSFLTSYMVKEPIDPTLPLGELKERLEYIKKKHKQVRNTKAKPCIAEGQLVLTHRGLVPIEHVTQEHRVWDGLEWVRHDGIIDKGIQEVITYEGLTATPDHKVISESGQTLSFAEAASQMVRLAKTGSGGQNIRFYNDRNSRGPSQERLSNGQRQVQYQWDYPLDLARRAYSRSSKVIRRKWSILRELLSRNWQSLEQALGRNCFTLQESVKSKLAQLWRTWDHNPILFSEGLYQLCPEGIASRELRGSRDRQNQQRWELRAWQPEVINSEGTIGKSEKYVPPVLARSGRSVGGFSKSILPNVDDVSSEETRHDRRGDFTTRRKARVYDIANAGPRHRFTVSDRLVFNCNLGYGFGMQGPGMADRYPEIFAPSPCQIHKNRFCGETCELVSMLDRLYSENKKWREGQLQEAYLNGGRNGSGWLLSKYNFIRWFHSIYSYRKGKCFNCDGRGCFQCDQEGKKWIRQNGSDMEDIYAFKPSNHAHCNFREVQVRLDDRGLLEKCGLVLPYHDALWLLCPNKYLDEIPAIYEEMIKPIVRLAHPKLCPAGLVVDVDVNIGPSWDKLTPLDMKTGMAAKQAA